MIRIDRNIKSFVMKLNRIKGVYTSSSCGGHKNPKGSRQPEGDFFVIMRIWNKDFLKKLNAICKDGSDFCSFDYNDLYETWCLSGMIESIYWEFEPFVEEYLTTNENLKPESEWETFYSYNDCPDGTLEFNNRNTLAYFREYSVLWN